jgi:bifunctional non-homologous end joining protein LigD
MAEGRPAFDRLSARLIAPRSVASFHARHYPVAFDALALDGDSTCGLQWSERRRLLVGLGLDDLPGPWRVNPAHDDGPALLDATRGMGLEGVVAKRCESRYLPGRRSKSWVKVKNISGWFDLIGWHPPHGKQAGGLVVAEDGGRSAWPSLPCRLSSGTG